jgi:fatty acid desaturase
MAAPREGCSGRSKGRIFRYTAWDAVPALLAFAHLGLLAAFFLAWPQLGWPARLAGALIYALAIGWSQDSIAHNFIHNPFFVSPRLNRLTAYALTLANGAPQTMYAYVHMRHHAGNSDQPDAVGDTVDPISIYRHGVDGRAEAMLSYVLLGFWRDDGPFTVARAIAARRPQAAKLASRGGLCGGLSRPLGLRADARALLLSRPVVLVSHRLLRAPGRRAEGAYGDGGVDL